jgi:hypothetical protein
MGDGMPMWIVAECFNATINAIDCCERRRNIVNEMCIVNEDNNNNIF